MFLVGLRSFPPFIFCFYFQATKQKQNTPTLVLQVIIAQFIVEMAAKLSHLINHHTN